jgi:hypothetical protein
LTQQHLSQIPPSSLVSTGDHHRAVIMAGVVRRIVVLLFLISTAIAQVSVRDFGARGDGVADDTRPLQSALDSIGTDRAGVVHLPPGLYRITAPLVVRRNQTLQGFGAPSVILADLSSWTGDRRVALRIENLAPSSEESVLANTNRLFGGFVVRAASAAIQRDSIGIEIKAHPPVPLHAAVNHALLRSVLRDISIRGFDTGLFVAEMRDSSIEDIHVQQCRRGIVIAGQSVNIFLDKLTLTNFPERVENRDDTIGLLIDSDRYPDGEGRPEGISIANSLIYGADTLVHVQRGLYVNIHHDMFDGARRNGIVLTSPEQVTIADNYIGSVKTADGAAIRVAPVNGPASGPIVRHNTIIGDEHPTYAGVLIEKGGKPRQGIEISGNTFQRVARAIVLEETPSLSVVDDNVGTSSSDRALVDVGPGGAGTSVINNRRTNAGDAVRVQKNASRHLRLENNRSPK